MEEFTIVIPDLRLIPWMCHITNNYWVGGLEIAPYICLLQAACATPGIRGVRDTVIE